VYASASAGAREKDSSTLVEVHTRRGGEIDKHPSLCFSVFASLSLLLFLFKGLLVLL